MIKYLTLILFAAALSCCKQPAQKQDGKGKYFEGFVEFDLSLKITNPVMLAELKDIYGKKCFTYINKEGFFSREYVDSNNIILRREIYRPDSLRFYYIVANSDTIYFADMTRQDGSDFVGMKEDSSFKILNHRVQAVCAKTILAGGKYGYSTYYNDVNYLLNPNVYKNVVPGGVEAMFSRSPHLTTGYRLTMEGNSVTGVAERIIQTYVDAIHFEIPKNKTIIERFY